MAKACKPAAGAVARPLGRNFAGTRMAWTRGLGLPYEREVRNAIEAQRVVFEQLGCIVEEAEPDFSDADEIFKVWRAWSFELSLGKELDKHPEQVKETVRWNIEQGRQLTGPQLGRAEAQRTQLYHRVRKFMERYEFFVLPVSQVLPFSVDTPYIREIDGVPLHSYIDWMKSCYYISTVGNPALSVPCAFSASGLPVGLQIVGRHQDDWGVLQLGHAFEAATNLWRRRPTGM